MIIGVCSCLADKLRDDLFAGLPACRAMMCKSTPTNDSNCTEQARGQTLASNPKAPAPRSQTPEDVLASRTECKRCAGQLIAGSHCLTAGVSKLWSFAMAQGGDFGHLGLRVHRHLLVFEGSPLRSTKASMQSAQG